MVKRKAKIKTKKQQLQQQLSKPEHIAFESEFKRIQHNECFARILIKVRQSTLF
jgi:hypothetical protein